MVGHYFQTRCAEVALFYMFLITSSWASIDDHTINSRLICFRKLLPCSSTSSALWLVCSFLKYFISFRLYACEYFPICKCVPSMCLELVEVKKQVPGTGITDSYEPTFRWWELNPCPFQEQQMFLTPELSLHLLWTFFSSVFQGSSPTFSFMSQLLNGYRSSTLNSVDLEDSYLQIKLSWPFVWCFSVYTGVQRAPLSEQMERRYLSWVAEQPVLTIPLRVKSNEEPHISIGEHFPVSVPQ